MSLHPAVSMGYDILLGGLNAAVADGLVSIKRDGDLALYCYTKEAVYTQAWTPITEVARGLILDLAEWRIVALPFPKFFNLGEGDRQAPAEDFEATEKQDGSLIIAFVHRGVRRTATKGSFNSEQAVAALQMLKPGTVYPGFTHLFELVGPENKIVVNYPHNELRFLGGYSTDGHETLRGSETWEYMAAHYPVAKVHGCGSLADLVAHTARLPKDQEGYVLRFADGTRLKLKGDEYKRLHACISRLSPLTVWDAMQHEESEMMRRELPEEFWADFDQMQFLMSRNLAMFLHEIAVEASFWVNQTDKEVGQALSSLPETVRSFIFPYRKGQMQPLTGRVREAVFKHIRPTGNKLAEYVPSYRLNYAQCALE